LSQVTTCIISCCAWTWFIVLVLFVLYATSWVVLVEYFTSYCDDRDELTSSLQRVVLSSLQNVDFC